MPTNHTPTIRQISNVGEDSVYEAAVAGDLIHTADTIDISGHSGITSGDKVFVVTAINVTDGLRINSNITYDTTLRKFTVAGDTNSSDAIVVRYRRCSI